MYRASETRPLALLVTLVVLSGQAFTQGGDFFSKLKAFQKAMGSKDASARLNAIDAFKSCGDPAGVKAFVTALADNEDDLARIRKRFTKAGRELHAAQAKITNVRMTQAAFDAAMAKIRPLQSRYDDLSARIQKLEAVSNALVDGVGQVVASVPEGGRERAIQEVVKTYEWASKPPEKALALKAMSKIDHPLISKTLIGAARLARNPGVRVAAFEAMRAHPKPEMTSAALEALEDKYWQVRVAALEVVKIAGGADSIDPLITALDHAEGRMVDELVDALKAVTKVNHHDNAALWRDWWGKNKASFRGRGKEAGVAGAVAKGEGGAGRGEQGRRRGGGTYFYGIQTRSQHIIYVLDISGSMAWELDTRYARGGGEPPVAPEGKSKLDQAVKELVSSITALKSGGTFNIVTYAIEHDVWKKKMQKVSKSSKGAARKWANALKPDGATNIFDALERAFNLVGRGSFDKGYGLAADTIFFLSDGQPNRGRVQSPNDILREIKKLNDLKKVKIHCIGLGSSADERFMRRLAAQNGGQYVHIGPRR